MTRFYQILFTFLLIPSISLADGADDTLNALALLSSRACCKVCSAGKACGDSCINASYTCHKGGGCACNGGGSSNGGSSNGGSSGGGSKPSGGGSKPSGSNNGNSSGGTNKPPPECPAIIARVDSLTYSARKNYRCFPKAVNAENKGFVKEPPDGSLNSKELVDLSVKRVKCPKIIVDKRTKLFTTNAEYLCYENKSKAGKAGFSPEI